MKILERIEPQPPKGIKYMLGGESWLPEDRRTPVRLECEEWGNLGPMELDPSIKPNRAGFRVRLTTIPAPLGARGFVIVNGAYYWTDADQWVGISPTSDMLGHIGQLPPQPEGER